MATALIYGADEEDEPMLFCRESHVCGASVEAQYYLPEGEIERRRRARTKHVCCHCYTDIHLEKNKDAEAREDRRVQGYLTMCKDCLKNGAKVAYKRVKANQVHVAK